jgi:glycosyltransferase involved in cell wall biosynthesis
MFLLNNTSSQSYSKEKKPILWFVSELYYPEETSTGYILTKIAENITDEFNVKIICGPPTYIKTSSSYLTKEFHNGVYIERCRIPHFDKNKFVSRAIKAFLLSSSVFLHSLFRIKKGECVLVVTNPATLLLVTAIVCFIKKAKMTILVHDVFPENIVASGLIPENSMVVKLLSRIISIPYTFSDSIIVIGKDMQELIKQKKVNAIGKIDIIPNWADINDVVPVSRDTNPIISECCLNSKFIVQFAGNIGRVQGIEFLLKAAKLIEDNDVHFMFVGNGANQGLILEQVNSAIRKNITFLGSQPRNMQSLFLGACDIGIVSLSPGMFGLGVPSKAYNIMAAGKPIIAMVDADSEIGQLVRTEGIGWVVSPGDVTALINAIKEAKSNLGLLDEMGRKARKLAQSKYTLAKIAEAYKTHFKKLIIA